MLYLTNDKGAGNYGSPPVIHTLTTPNVPGLYLHTWTRGAGGGGGGGSATHGGGGGGSAAATLLIIPVEPGQAITWTLQPGARGGDGNGVGVGAAGDSLAVFTTIDFGQNRIYQLGGGSGGQGGVAHGGPNFLDPYQGGRGGSTGATDEFGAWVLALQAAGYVVTQQNDPAINGQSSIGLIGGHGGGEGDSGGGGRGGHAPFNNHPYFGTAGVTNGLSGQGAYRRAWFTDQVTALPGLP